MCSKAVLYWSFVCHTICTVSWLWAMFFYYLLLHTVHIGPVIPHCIQITVNWLWPLWVCVFCVYACTCVCCLCACVCVCARLCECMCLCSVCAFVCLCACVCAYVFLGGVKISFSWNRHCPRVIKLISCREEWRTPSQPKAKPTTTHTGSAAS